jgi:anti-sigma regulatory factor (Ser/Thr protein kinase)
MRRGSPQRRARRRLDSLSVQTRRFSNDLAELRRVSEWLRTYCSEAGIDNAVTYHVDLCLDEAVSNIIRYGYENGSRDTIVVSVEMRHDRLRVVISDGGREFNPLRQPPPAVPTTIEDVPVGGFGIHLMRAFANAVDYRRINGRNIVTLDFLR